MRLDREAGPPKASPAVPPAFRDDSALPRPVIRGALAAGLLAMLALWLVTGYELLRNLAEAERRVNEVHASFVRGEETLSAIRTSVLLGSIYLRDALVDATGNREYYRDELGRIRADIEQRLPHNEAATELPADSVQWQQLRQGLDAYWTTLDLFLRPDAPLTYVQGTGLLRREVVPARTNVLRIVDRIADLQRIAQRQREAEASLLYRDVRVRIVAIGGGMLVIGLVVSWFVVRRVAGLERELHRRRIAETENRKDLERLSARLVDVQEQERRALARELHDEVGQALTAIKMEVGVALRGAPADARTRGSLEEARAIAEATLQGVRDLSQLLHPSTLDDFGLPETLSAYLRSFSKRTGIHTDLQFRNCDGRLPQPIEVGVYRILQEALTNVARHSGAGHVVVVLARDEHAVHVTVEDDGAGFVRNAVRTNGLGVIGMRERAQSLDGSFSIEDRSGGGTRICVTVPLPDHENPAIRAAAS
jgi:signal transduction histidine kinase